MRYNIAISAYIFIAPALVKTGGFAVCPLAGLVLA
jgi:hypothetical protein